MTRSSTTRSRGARWTTLAVASVFAMTGCSSMTVARPVESPEPTAAIVTIAMPELAPYPEPAPPLTEAEAEAKRIEDADRQWQGVLANYPDAVRPDVAFEGYVTEETYVEVLRSCYETAGLPVDEGRVSGNADGPPDSIGYSGSTEADAIAGYACAVAHPTKATSAGPSDAQLGWAYDYLVSFFAPCLEANGIEVPEPPGREVWVAAWPEYLWFPSASDDLRFMDPEMDAALHEACPDPDTYVVDVLWAE